MKVIEKATIGSLRDTFEGENIQTHYKILGYEIDLCFHDYKLDEKDHQDRDINREIERKKALEKKKLIY